ncbi:hypothetical protein [Vibrio cyclitrophicus]|uniref:hypothetical protein n=1 Tax=Vibrio cyclitrophicus TaxID=47951 RepID=UPI0007EECEE4|nr:hypothetical protein [Vibrio cyclitrophicus]OBT13233.1 hypothetical protein A9265_20850 [Vibrio cyclitrophicus]
MSPFFENEETKKLFNKLANHVDALKTTTEFDEKRNASILVVCQSMVKKAKLWDERCQINIHRSSPDLTYYIGEALQQQHPTYLGEILGSMFRFLLEFHISGKNERNVELNQVRKFCIDNISQFSDDAQDDIGFATSDMPIAILKEIINNPAVSSIQNLESTTAKFESIKNEWDKELEDKEARVSKLKGSLDDYKDAFNFVGLSEGFNQLAKQKREEMANVLFWLRITAILIILPLLSEITFLLTNINSIDKLTQVMLLVSIPTVSLLVILVYYFRVLLSNYKSIQSQLLQIDLRMTLCRFIHNYSDYASDMKSKDNSSLEKFENVVFSGITSNSENIPSTFDGVEQLSKLIKSVRP